MPKKALRREKIQVIFYIVTGMSGAGKSSAIKCLEDVGFFCVDNLPIALLSKFGELCLKSGSKLNRVAVGVDIRESRFLHDLMPSLAELKRQGIEITILFFDADNNTLIRRYSETRRKHPLGKRIVEGIAQERTLLSEIKAQADRICDTSNLTINELREILSTWVATKDHQEIHITIISFGYKYGIPLDADIVFDVRFLPNPNYVRGLKKLTGKERRVQTYILRHTITKKFLNIVHNLFLLLIPYYIIENKSYLTVAVGCTGGRHRSVVLAGRLAGFFAAHGHPARIIHRDIDR